MDAAAKEHGLRIIAPDRPGIGLSDFQPGRTLLDWPVMLEELAAHVGAEKFHLMGWSGGGPYVLATAYAMPERVLSATICCGAPPLRFLGFEHMFWIYRLMIRLREPFPSVLGGLLRLGERISRGDPQRAPLRWLMQMLGAEDRRVLSDPEVFQVVREGILEALRRGPRSVIADADIYLSEWGFEVGAIRTLVHFWHGKEDRNISWKYSEQVAALMPQSTTEWLEKDGHYSLPITHVDAILRKALGKSPVS
jgi:pimeloyl-ACP methyl ester carboxylesterase